MSPTNPIDGKAFKSFTWLQGRAIGLVNLHMDLHREDTGSHPCSADVLRGAVALGVASMDAYFTRRFAELLAPFRKRNCPNQRLIELLSSAGLDTEAALELAVTDRPFRRVRALVQRHLSDYTTQQFPAINEFFLALGFKDLSKHAQGLAHRKTLLRSVELLVERRHNIVHEGDIGHNGNLGRIDSSETVKRMRVFVSNAEVLILKSEEV